METMLYKESFYNFKLATEDKRLLIYNSKTGAICSVNEDKMNVILKILEKPNRRLDEESFNNLLKLGFITENSEDELQTIKDMYHKHRNQRNKIFLMMLPAEACNFSCPYCFTYEQRNMYMENWVYDSVYKYIERIAQENPDDTTYLSLAWFGGEPLLASTKILEFMYRLNDLKSKYKLEVDSGIVSNGYLLNINLFKDLIKSGVFNYHITIDGDEESHNSTRQLKTGQNTFSEIYNNFKDISNSMPKDTYFNFTIRVNFLKNTYNKMQSLINQLSADFSTDKRFNLFFKPIYNIETSRSDIDSIATEICSNNEAFENQRNLAYMTMEGGMSDFDKMKIFEPIPQPICTWCDTVQPFAHIVGADGSIFSCDTLMVDEEHRAGVITKDGEIILNSTGEKWKKSIFEEETGVIKECMTCKLLPVCMGGCKRAWLTSDSKACKCTEDKIYDTLERYVSQRKNA